MGGNIFNRQEKSWPRSTQLCFSAHYNVGCDREGVRCKVFAKLNTLARNVTSDLQELLPVQLNSRVAANGQRLRKNSRGKACLEAVK